MSWHNSVMSVRCIGIILAWHCNAIKLLSMVWCHGHGFLFFCSYDVMVSWHVDVMKLWCISVMALCCHAVMVKRCDAAKHVMAGDK